MMYRYLRSAVLLSLLGLATTLPGTLQAKDRHTCGDKVQLSEVCSQFRDAYSRTGPP